MKKYYISILILIMASIPLLNFAGSAIKIEYGNTSMTVELSQNPRIITENGNVIVKTSTQSVTVSLPCKVTLQGSSTAIEESVIIRNNDVNSPISVFTIDGKKIATLHDKEDIYSLKPGVYIINGKKVIIR